MECTVAATPQGGGSPVTSTVGHPLSYPTTSVELHNLKADSVYEIAVRCKGDDGKEEAASNEKALHTTKSDAHPGVVNLHPTSPTSVAFHIVAPKASECDAEKYDVFIGRLGGSTSKTTVSQVDVSLSGLAPNTKYEVAVDAVCKGGSVSKKSAPAFVTTTPTPAPTPGPTGPTVLDKAPTFHTITVFGPHPEVSVYLNGTVPTGATVVIDVACADGFKSSVSAPASVPETTLHLATGLPPGTTCTYTAYTANGSKRSPTATEQRIVPSSALESPSLVNWKPDFKTKGGTVAVVEPLAVNCTGGIVEYTVTGTKISGTSILGRKRHLLQSPAFTVTSAGPGLVTITNGVSYNSGTPTLDMEVVGKCADGSLTPSGHLSVNLASCPAISNCATLDDAGGSCQCKTCAPGFVLATTGYVCSPPPPGFLASNGVTVMCPNAAVGQSFDINGVTYTKRDRYGLDGLLNGGPSQWPELSTTCTSGISRFAGLFADIRTTFNEPIGSWDMSSATNCRFMWVLTTAARRSCAPTRSLAHSLTRSFICQVPIRHCLQPGYQQVGNGQRGGHGEHVQIRH